jgi:hypothetical protein
MSLFNNKLQKVQRSMLDKGVTDELDGLGTSLAQKALQSDLQTTNTNVTANATAITLKADKSYVDGKFGNMGNTKTFKGSTTFASLPTSGNNVDDYWYVTDKSSNYCWNGTSFVDIGNNLNIGVGVIDDINLKQTYAKVTASKNLFNPATITVGQYIGYADGLFNPVVGYNESDFIKVSPNTNYVKSDSQQLVFYNSNKTYISGLASATTFTTPSNCAYVRITVKDNVLSTYQLELGTVATAYVPYSITIDPNNIGLNSIGANKLQDTYAKKIQGKNLFNSATAIAGKYVSYSTGILEVSSSFYASDWIPCQPSTNYVKSDSQQLAFFDANKTYLSGLASTTTFTTPANCYFMRITVANSVLSSYQLETGTVATSFESYGTYVQVGDISPSINNIPYVYESVMKIQLPRYIFMVVGEEFSIYWRNIIKLSNKMKSGNYYIRAQKVVGGVYSQVGDDYGYRWCYTPSATEQFDLEIRLYNTFNDAIVTSKVVTVIVSAKNQATAKSATLITLGDSFTDGYGISKYVYDFSTAAQNVSLNMIGLNDSGETGVKDDAWSGYSYSWFYNTATGYLRSDRPLSDANWDAGWGLNETYGWTAGQTYNDLTPTQRSHGYTRNEFYNSAVGHFDFSYFMANRFPSYVPSGQTGSHVDAVLSFLGLNDAIWQSPTYLKSTLATCKTNIDGMINSIHAWDSNIVIMLHLVTPQQDSDSYMNTFSNTFLHGDRAKYCQEIWNDFILSNYDSDAMRASNVYVVATNANFDTRTGILTKTITPNKFDLTYQETVSSDVHPTATGAKYIADTARNFVINKVIK